MIDLIHGDCVEKMKNIEDNSIDLICIDPPYNIGKDKKWDKWKTVSDYVEFMGKVFFECQRILKDNGSFYFFHNDFLQIVELQNWINKNTKLNFKQLIVWNQRFKGMEWIDTNNRKRTYRDYSAILTNKSLRNYKKMAEYCLYYTFQDETGLNKIKSNENTFTPIKEYLKKEKQKSKLTLTDLNEILTGKRKSDLIAKRYFGVSQWELPTKQMYLKLQTTGYFNRSYESLRQEYESLRYTFNNQKTHHSVWNYEIAKKQGHITPKPVDLIENIIKHSSNENDVVLDCFMGSGTTGIACLNLKRKFIGIEKDETYFKLAKERIENHKNQPELFAMDM